MAKAKAKAKPKAKKAAPKVEPKKVYAPGKTGKLLIGKLPAFLNAKLNAKKPKDECVDVTDLIKGFCEVEKL